MRLASCGFAFPGWRVLLFQCWLSSLALFLVWILMIALILFFWKSTRSILLFWKCNNKEMYRVIEEEADGKVVFFLIFLQMVHAFLTFGLQKHHMSGFSRNHSLLTKLKLVFFFLSVYLFFFSPYFPRSFSLLSFLLSLFILLLFSLIVV